MWRVSVSAGLMNTTPRCFEKYEADEWRVSPMLEMEERPGYKTRTGYCGKKLDQYIFSVFFSIFFKP